MSRSAFLPLQRPDVQADARDLMTNMPIMGLEREFQIFKWLDGGVTGKSYRSQREHAFSSGAGPLLPSCARDDQIPRYG
jgi:hypothetical protein